MLMLFKNPVPVLLLAISSFILNTNSSILFGLIFPFICILSKSKKKKANVSRISFVNSSAHSE